MSMIASLLIAEGSLFSWKERGLMSLILSQEKDLRARGLCGCLETPKTFKQYAVRLLLVFFCSCVDDRIVLFQRIFFTSCLPHCKVESATNNSQKNIKSKARYTGTGIITWTHGCSVANSSLWNTILCQNNASIQQLWNHSCSSLLIIWQYSRRLYCHSIKTTDRRSG